MLGWRCCSSAHPCLHPPHPRIGQAAARAPLWGGFCRAGTAGDVPPRCCCLGRRGTGSRRIPCVPELAGRGAQPTGLAGFAGRAKKSLCAGGPLPAALTVPGSLPHSPWPQKRKSCFFPPSYPQRRLQWAARRFAEGLALACPLAHRFSLHPTGEGQRLGPGRQRRN